MIAGLSLKTKFGMSRVSPPSIQVVPRVRLHRHSARSINSLTQVILKFAGRDATKEYAEIHNLEVVKDTISLECFKGNLDRSTITEDWKQGVVKKNAAQATSEDEKPPLHNVLNSFDFEEIAAKTASTKTFVWYSSEFYPYLDIDTC